MGTQTIDAPTSTAEQEAADALAAEQARIDAGAELEHPTELPPETATRTYDDLSDLTEEQRLAAGDARTREEFEEYVDQVRRENADTPPAPAPEVDAAAEIEDAHADGDGGAPSYQDDRTDTEKLAGGTPLQQTIDGRERHPVAADDERDDAAAAMILRGDGQLGWSVGGKKPSKASLRLTGGSFQISEGQLAKGSTRTVVVTGQVNDVGFRDNLDRNTNDAIECERKHGAKIIGAKLVPEGYRVAVVPDDGTDVDGELEL